jgi:hypothetical protein
VRFPILQLALDKVARYFAIPKLNRISDGLEALSLHTEYQNSRDEDRRRALKADLIEYNRDDLEALVGVAKQLAILSGAAGPGGTDPAAATPPAYTAG